MGIVNPDATWFQYLGGAGAAEIALGLILEEEDWRAINRNDIYLYSYGCRRTFWSFASEANAINCFQSSGPSAQMIGKGFWSLSESRQDIIVRWDLEQVDVRVRLYTNAGVLIATQTPGTGARSNGSHTFTGVAATATEGYFTLEMTPRSTGVDAWIYSLKLIEQRVAQADLP